MTALIFDFNFQIPHICLPCSACASCSWADVFLSLFFASRWGWWRWAQQRSPHSPRQLLLGWRLSQATKEEETQKDKRGENTQSYKEEEGGKVQFPLTHIHQHLGTQVWQTTWLQSQTVLLSFLNPLLFDVSAIGTQVYFGCWTAKWEAMDCLRQRGRLAAVLPLLPV